MSEDYISEIFEGKESFNQKELETLNKKIRKNNFVENQYNEAKTITGIIRIKSEEELYENQLIKPLISFLNSIDGKGTLYLGINTPRGASHFLDVVPVSEKTIKNEEHLRELIVSKLGVIPREFETPNISIKKIKFKKGNVYIIGINRVNKNSVYYSKLSDNIYKRSYDVTSKLNLTESLQLIESKRNPLLKLRVSFSRFDGKPNLMSNKLKKMKLIYNLSLVNDGLEPSELTTIILGISNRGEYLPEIEFPNDFQKRDSPPGAQKGFQLVNNTNFGHLPVYPMTPLNLGNMSIEWKEHLDLDLEFVIKIMDKKGLTLQSFSLRELFKPKERGTVLDFNPVDEKVEYISYI